MNKREFIKKSTILASGALILPSISIESKASAIEETRLEPFALPKLPYAFNALEPNIDAKTMEIHHGKHHAAYIAKLNEAIKGTKYEKTSLKTILSELNESSPPAIRNNAGGHYNHIFFWESMTPEQSSISDPNFIKAIETAFGEFEKFKEQFTTQAKNLFGSGWTWLCLDKNKKLFISNTSNQDNPLMKNLVKNKGIPILGLDIWEHAYYLNYQNKRADYISNFFNIIDWKKVEERYNAGL